MPRATPLAPSERRAAICDAVLPLLLQQGPTVSTRDIAAACGVAEGTIFRAFPTKQALIEHVVDHALSPDLVVTALRELPGDAPLEDLVLRMVEIVQKQHTTIHQLLPLLAHSPEGSAHKHPHGMNRTAQAMAQAMVAILTPRANELNTSPPLAATSILALSIGSMFAPDDQSDAHAITHTLLNGISKPHPTQQKG